MRVFRRRFSQCCDIDLKWHKCFRLEYQEFEGAGFEVPGMSTQVLIFSSDVWLHVDAMKRSQRHVEVYKDSDEAPTSSGSSNKQSGQKMMSLMTMALAKAGDVGT
jgi:hypothetical protein